MSVRLRDLIRAVRACKTAAEEREVIAKESAALREAFREQDQSYRHRNVAKLMYIHMLGYPTHFGQMETLKLIAAAGFPEKRIGYLGLMILLDERQEVLMLVTNTIKMDLTHKNHYIGGLAMAALGNICSAEMARDLAPDIEKLMQNGNPYIRKKAALCAVRIVRKVPELVEQFADRAAECLVDRNHAVALSGATLMLEICELDPGYVDHYRKHVPAMCKLLKGLLTPGMSPEHDVAGITNPFLQVKVMRLLRYLGRGNAEASDQMSDILAQVASVVDCGRNAGNAVLYETVQTIMGVESIGGLRVLAVNILGKFLANKDNNIRYVALNTLAKAVSVDTQAVQRHRATIVDCVRDADVTIRRRALELVYGLVNEGNIKALTRELLDYLSVSDTEFKPDLTAKICTLIQRFAPDKQWYLDNLLQVMAQAGQHVKEEVVRALIVLVTNAPELHGYAVRSMYRNLHAYQDVAERSLVISALWCMGEFGEMLLPGAGGPLLDGEPACNVNDKEVVDLIDYVMRRARSDAIIREYGLTAVMKLTARLPGQVPRLRAILERHSRSAQLEAQARACEYSRMFKFNNIRPQLLERMPALDESEYASNMAGEVKGTQATPGKAVQGGAAAGAAAGAAGAPGDLLGVDLLADGAASAVPATAAVAALEDLLGGGGAAPAPAADVLDLLGSTPPRPAAPPAAAAEAPPPAAEAPSASAGPVTFPPFVVWQQDGLSVSFSCSKASAGSSMTEITATYKNEGAVTYTDFNLQAAVPKFMQLRLDPATGSTLAPDTSATQRIVVDNTMHGTKALVMRLRISYSLDGQPQLQQAEVANFPQGL